MSDGIITALAISLGVTLIVEAGFFLLVGKRNKKDLLLLILVNVITNPAVVLLYWLTVIYTEFNSSAVKTALELFAVLTEGYYFKKYGQDFKWPLLFSFSANVVSFGIGVFIQQFI